MADNALTRLSLAGRLGVGLVLAVLICGLFYWLKYTELDEQETAKTSSLARLQAEIRSLEVTASKLDQFQRDVAAKEAKLETLKRILPADKETPELMKKVQYLAAQSNLAIKKFTPGQTVKKAFQTQAQAGRPGAPGAPGAPPAPVAPAGAAAGPGAPGAAAAQEYYQEWPINIEVDSSYHNLGLFFDRVSRLSRLVNVGEVKIKAASRQTPSNTVSVQCVATTYVYVETPEAPTAAGAAPATPR